MNLSNFEIRVLTTIETQISAETPSLIRSARLLGISTRSLQRRLEAMGITYSDLVRVAKSEFACRHLGEPRYRIAEIAQALGYSDPSSFSRAFRQWKGVSPREYRQQNLKSP